MALQQTSGGGAARQTDAASLPKDENQAQDFAQNLSGYAVHASLRGGKKGRKQV